MKIIDNNEFFSFLEKFDVHQIGVNWKGEKSQIRNFQWNTHKAEFERVYRSVKKFSVEEFNELMDDFVIKGLQQEAKQCKTEEDIYEIGIKFLLFVLCFYKLGYKNDKVKLISVIKENEDIQTYMLSQ
jgi:hypothetical protein